MKIEEVLGPALIFCKSLYSDKETMSVVIFMNTNCFNTFNHFIGQKTATLLMKVTVNFNDKFKYVCYKYKI